MNASSMNSGKRSVTDDQMNEAIAEAVALETADAKLAALVRLRTSVLRERRLLRGLTIVSIVVGCTGIVLGGLALHVLDDVEKDRADNLRGSCHQYNEQQARAREGNKAQLLVVLDTNTSGRELTPEQQARIAAITAAHDAVIDSSFPDRDCSPEGIAKYLDATSKEQRHE